MLGTLGYNSYFSTKQAGLGKYMSSVLASILYKMDKFNVTVDNLRSVANGGGAGHRSDAPMYASNHIFLDGSTQSVDYVTISGSDYVYFDVATKAHISGTASGATTNITASHSNFTSLKGGASVVTADKLYLDANPEAVARLVDGETVAGLSFDLTDIEAFYPGNEGEASGAYVQNVGVPLGSDLVQTGTPVNVGGGVISLQAGGYNATSDGTSGNTIRPKLDVSGCVAGLLYHYEINETIVSGDCTDTRLYNGDSYTYSAQQAGGIKSGIFVAGATVPWVSYDGIQIFNIDVVATIREASAAEITNYASTCRTNLDLTNYGASNLLYKQDATGRWLGMADTNLIEFTGDSRYVDTGWIPDITEDFTVELVSKLSNSTDLQLNGTSVAYGSQDFRIGHGGGDAVRVYANGANLLVAKTAESMYQIVVVNDVTTNRLNFYVNGVYVSFISTVGAGILSNFYLGNTNISPYYTLKSLLGLFKVHKNKVMTADEVTTAYAQAKLTYPTLP